MPNEIDENGPQRMVFNYFMGLHQTGDMEVIEIKEHSYEAKIMFFKVYERSYLVYVLLEAAIGEPRYLWALPDMASAIGLCYGDGAEVWKQTIPTMEIIRKWVSSGDVTSSEAKTLIAYHAVEQFEKERRTQ